MHKLIDASIVTVKADAAHRSFNSMGDGIVWAVVDSGIDRTHPHFGTYQTVDDPAVAKLHRSFLPAADGVPDDPLTDDGRPRQPRGRHHRRRAVVRWTGDVVVTENRFNVDNPRGTAAPTPCRCRTRRPG